MSASKIRLFFSLGVRVVPDLLLLLITYWPGELGNLLRYRYYKRRLKYLGKGAVIDVGVYMASPRYISVGDGAHIDRGVTLIAGPPREGQRRICRKNNPRFGHETGEICIGRNVHIAPGAYLLGHGGISVADRSCITTGARVYSMSHHYRNLDDPNDRKLYSFSNRVPMEDQLVIVGPVVMEENAALGLNSVALPGSTIGRNSWVGVLSVAVGTIPPNVIAVGCPAAVIKQRCPARAASPDGETITGSSATEETR